MTLMYTPALHRQVLDRRAEHARLMRGVPADVVAGMSAADPPKGYDLHVEIRLRALADEILEDAAVRGAVERYADDAVIRAARNELAAFWTTRPGATEHLEDRLGPVGPPFHLGDVPREARQGVRDFILAVAAADRLAALDTHER